MIVLQQNGIFRDADPGTVGDGFPRTTPKQIEELFKKLVVPTLKLYLQ
jgi:hypothetical protein